MPDHRADRPSPDRGLSIVINAIPLLDDITGVGTCIYNIARKLHERAPQNRYTYFYNFFSNRLRCPGGGGRSSGSSLGLLSGAARLLKRTPVTRQVGRRLMRGMQNLMARRRGFDIYYEPNYVPIDLPARHVVSTVYDFSFHHHPEWHPRSRIEHLRRHFYKGVARSDIITVISNFVKEEAVDVLSLPADRIRVSHLGCDHTVFHPRDDDAVKAFRRAHGIPGDFILSVGSIEPRKNIDALLRAYARLPEPVRREVTLVLIGHRGWCNTNTMELIARMRGQVRFLGYLPINELALAYNAARAMAYPSLYEGFGLPPVEAMACGCPVVTSRVAALPEVCGDAAHYVDPADTDDIARGLHDVVTDAALRENLARRGRARAAQFTWGRTADRLLGIFNELQA